MSSLSSKVLEKKKKISWERWLVLQSPEGQLRKRSSPVGTLPPRDFLFCLRLSLSLFLVLRASQPSRKFFLLSTIFSLSLSPTRTRTRTRTRSLLLCVLLSLVFSCSVLFHNHLLFLLFLHPLRVRLARWTFPAIPCTLQFYAAFFSLLACLSVCIQSAEIAQHERMLTSSSSIAETPHRRSVFRTSSTILLSHIPVSRHTRLATFTR